MINKVEMERYKIMTFTEKLIGAELISITPSKVEIQKDGRVYSLDILKDSGDCCGYNEITTKLILDDKSKPIITNITLEHTKEYEGDRCIVTFFGEYKPIAEVNSCSSSGSGWKYGACVKLYCNPLDINEILSWW